jgi:hypothetical protein
MNGEEIREQVGQDEVTGEQKLLRDMEEIEMSDTDADTCSEKDKLSNHSNDLLNMLRKTMQEDEIERERIKRETEEKQEGLKGKKKQKLKELGGGSLESRVQSRTYNGQLCRKRQYSIYI